MNKIEGLAVPETSAEPRIYSPDCSFGDLINNFNSVFQKRIVDHDIANILNEVNTTEMEGENYKITLNNGTICRYSKDRLLHSKSDYAIITPDGNKISLVDGCLHSLKHDDEVLPSIVYKTNNGILYAQHNKGRLHSHKDMPAINLDGVVKMWFNEGIVHRDCDTPVDYHSPNPAIEHTNFKAWLKDGHIIDAFPTPVTAKSANN